METYKQVMDQIEEPNQVKLMPANIVGPRVIRMETPCSDLPPVIKKVKLRPPNVVGPRVIRMETPCLDLPTVIKKENSRLQLKYISSSIEGNSKLRVFVNSNTAKKHILKHVLGHGESSMWSILFPNESARISRILNSRTGKYLSVGEVSLEDMQSLYGIYANAIESEIKAAESFGTVIEDSLSTLYVGLTGLFIVVRKNVVKTAYYPMWSDEKKFVEFACISSDKKKRDKKRRLKAIKKRSTKGTPERRLYKSGLKATVTIFRNTKSTERDFNTKQQMAGLVAKNMPMKYHQWLVEYLALHDDTASVTMESKQLSKDSVAA